MFDKTLNNTNWFTITDTDGVTVTLNIKNIDYLRNVDKQHTRIVTTSGNSFEVENNQLKGLYEAQN